MKYKCYLCNSLLIEEGAYSNRLICNSCPRVEGNDIHLLDHYTYAYSITFKDRILRSKRVAWNEPNYKFRYIIYADNNGSKLVELITDQVICKLPIINIEKYAPIDLKKKLKSLILLS